MEHPLAMDIEAMRRAGYATVDALVARLANPEADPVLLRAEAAEMRSRLGGPPPEDPGEYGAARGGRMAAGAGRAGPDRRRQPSRKPHPSHQPPDSLKISLTTP